MATIANFTPDTIVTEYIGVFQTFKPGDIIKQVDEARANAVLNNWGRRGLVRLEFDSDEEEKKEEAMAAYQAFWELQVDNFNNLNLGLKAQNSPYISPKKELLNHAKELGLDLVTPWKTSERKEADKLRADNASLLSRLEAMESKISALTGTAEVEKPVDPTSLVAQYKSMTRDDFYPWLLENIDTVFNWPLTVIIDLRRKFDKFYKDENGEYMHEWPFPI